MKLASLTMALFLATSCNNDLLGDLKAEDMKVETLSIGSPFDTTLAYITWFRDGVRDSLTTTVLSLPSVQSHHVIYREPYPRFEARIEMKNSFGVIQREIVVQFGNPSRIDGRNRSVDEVK